MDSTVEDVYCTFLMSDSYLPGAAVLAHSLRDCGTSKKLAVLVTLDSLLYDTITELKTLFDYVLPVDKIANSNLENLSRLDRLDLRFAFTKIALWQQTQFRKIVYIDADVVALRAMDELFQLDASFAAAPDIGWPDCFNTGLMLLLPNTGDYRGLQTMAASGTSFDGADQGLLNEYFGNRPWHRLSFTYNCTPSSSYQYEPAYRHFRSNISATHFIGKDKPWQKGRNAINANGSGVYKELLGSWWTVYDRHYKAAQSSAYGKVEPDQYVTRFVKDEKSHSALRLAAEGRTAVSGEPSNSAQLESDEARKNREASTRHFSPPPMPWDATRGAPPAGSRPEAGALSNQHYRMSHDSHLFHAPQSYPEPPRGMYYQVPPRPEPAEQPNPIFPWEQSSRKAKPTRVFPEPAPIKPQAPPPPAPTEKSEPEQTPSQQSTSSQTPLSEPLSQTYDEFSRTNAWDSVGSIEQYVRAMKQNQAKRGNVQVLHNDDERDFPLDYPTTTTTKRRESLILTDFPTEVERPSLPVTPAPVRRPAFWSEERDEAGELPAAEGVPDQAEWDPVRQLEQLRKASLAAAEDLPNNPAAIKRDIPMRDLLESSAPVGSLPREVGSPMSSPPPGTEGRRVATGLSRAAPAAAVEEAEANPDVTDPASTVAANLSREERLRSMGNLTKKGKEDVGGN